MKKSILGMSSFFGVLSSLATVTMMVVIAIDVVARATSGASVPGVMELGETVLVAAVFLGMAYAGASDSHIAVDLVTDRLPKAVSRWVVAIGWMGTSVILAWLIYATGIRAWNSFLNNESRMGLVNWPLWPARWLIVIGLSAMLIIAITNVVRLIRGKEVLGRISADDDLVVSPSLTGERLDQTALSEQTEPPSDLSELSNRKEPNGG